VALAGWGNYWWGIVQFGFHKDDFVPKGSLAKRKLAAEFESRTLAGRAEVTRVLKLAAELLAPCSGKILQEVARVDFLEELN
jgi:hypothetical protein